MTGAVTRLLKIFAGMASVFLGVMGWFLPILPGTLFIVLGLALLSAQSGWVRRKIDLLKARCPHHVVRLQALKDNLTSKLRGERTS